MNKCLIFDVWGDYAHFRKFYTTSSPITLPFPPKATIVGMISAIIGLDKDIYLKSFSKEDYHIALGIINPIKTSFIMENWLDVKRWSYELRTKEILGKKQPKQRILAHTQIKIEWVKDPKYRIYFYHKDNDIQNNLKQHLKNHTSFYTVTLGASENLANFNYIDEQDFQLSDTELTSIRSVIRKEHLKEIDWSNPQEIKILNYPIDMTENRITECYDEYLYENNGNSIKAKLYKAMRINDYVICPM